MSTYIIGVGGVGSWLAPAVQKLFPKDDLWLVDGDKLESSNMDRQLFDEKDIGRFKAEALGRKYGIKYINSYYGFGTLEHNGTDWILCCCDNHAARLSCIRATDMFGCNLIIGANETNSAEAYFYKHQWSGTAYDPRVMYPEIVNDLTGNPMARAAGCTGEAQVQNRQLSSANFMAAALMQHLLVLWRMEVVKLEPAIIATLPHQLHATISRVGYRLLNQSLDIERTSDERKQSEGVSDQPDATSRVDHDAPAAA